MSQPDRHKSSAAQDRAATIRCAIYANGSQEWAVPIAALDALLAENERLQREAEDLRRALVAQERQWLAAVGAATVHSA